MSTLPETDDPKTLDEYAALAQATGEWGGASAPEFSADGEKWSPFWLGQEPPALARATVFRRGVENPAPVIVAWREGLPADDENRAAWERNPMQRFGAYALRAAYRRNFSDVIAPRERAERPAAAPEAEAPQRDWETEIAAAWTADEVHALHAAMKQARAVTVKREGALRDRLVELSIAADQSVATAAESAVAIQRAWQPEGTTRPPRGGSGVSRPKPAVVPHPPAPDVPHLTRPMSRKQQQRHGGDKKGGRR